MKKTIGNWTIEHTPGKTRAFVTSKWVSGFVSLYGKGDIGIDSHLALPESVKKYLVDLSLNVEATK